MYVSVFESLDGWIFQIICVRACEEISLNIYPGETLWLMKYFVISGGKLMLPLKYNLQRGAVVFSSGMVCTSNSSCDRYRMKRASKRTLAGCFSKRKLNRAKKLNRYGFSEVLVLLPVTHR